MRRQIAYLPYQRAFRSPLRTAHGLWTERTGFIVRIEHSDHVGYGEIAPIPDFGTETIEAAEEFLRQYVQTPEMSVPDGLPCCAFGLSAALAMSGGTSDSATDVNRSYLVSALLPAGEAAKKALCVKLAQGFQTFKWKIGVESVSTELAVFSELVELLPEGGTLRLDANGGLQESDLSAWIDAIRPRLSKVEYLEQPLPVGQEARMAAIMDATGVAIALDESLNGNIGRLWLQQWQGPLVVKPALMGNVATLLSILEPVADQVVLSSVFETTVGVVNALALAHALPAQGRPLGYDTLAAFDDTLQSISSAAAIDPSNVSSADLETLWQTLLHSS